MFGFRSARGRATFVGLLLTLFLVSVTAFTIWRNEDYNDQLDKLERASNTASILEHARAQLYLQMNLLFGLAFSRDASLVDAYRQAGAALEQDLIQARAEVTHRGDEAQLALLDDLAVRMADFEAMADQAIPRLLEMDASQAAQMAADYLPSTWDTVDAMLVDLDQLAANGRADLAAERAAMDREADVTFWLIIARSAIAFVLTAGIATVVLLWILRPLASLRLSARTIASGNLEARAKVFGPEEVASLARDVNQMTDALAAKTEEYIATTNLTGDIIAKIDREGRWTFLNDSACQFLGRPRDELLGTDALASMHPDDVEATLEAVREVRATKEPRRGLVNRMVTPMGTKVVEWNAYPLFDKEGRDAGFQITGRDITERKQAEEALRESEEKYRDLVENISEIVYALDADGVITYVSPVVEQLGGYTPSEVIGRSFTEFIHPDDLLPLMQSFQKTISGNPEPFEYRILSKSGEVHWVRTSSRLIREGERVVGVRAVLMDITDRKQAEEALRESEEKYRRLVEDSVDGLVIVEGSEIRFANSALLEMLGCQSQEEIVGRPFTEFVSPGYRELMMERARARQRGEDPPSRYEIRALRKDGSEFPAEVSIGRIIYQGRVALQGIVRDITERQRAADELLRRDAVLQVINRVLRKTLTCETHADVASVCIEAARELTGSQFGFIGEINQAGRFDTIAMTDPGWEACRMPKTSALRMLKDMELRGIWGRVLIDERPLIVNDPASHPDRVGTPEGHPPLTSFLGVPLKHQGKTIGMIGLANKESGYDVADQENVEAISAAFVEALNRKRAEEGLKEAERRYRELFEEAPAMYATCRDQGGTAIITDCNELFLTTLGYTRDEVVGRPVADFYTPESRAQLLEGGGFQRALAGQFVAEERQLLTKDGRIVDTVLRAVPEIGPDGKALGTRAMYVDITERKRMEEALRESEARFRDVAESALEWIWEVDAEGTYTYASPVVERILGYAPEEVVGKHFYDLFHPEDREELKKAAFEAFARKEPIREFLNRNVHKNGNIVWLSTTGIPVLNEHGNLRGYRGADIDITERKRAEEALRESEARYRLLAENTSDLIWIVGLDLKYKYVSPAITRMRGYTVEEIVGASIKDTVTPASLELARKTLAEELALERAGGADPNRSVKLELEMYCKDGSTIWTEMNMTFLRDSEGRPTGILGVTRDISERKRAEEERERLLAELEARAITDSLTGLYNHAYFYQRLAQEIDRSRRYGHRFALVMMDVDAFKHYNDSRGHQAGDAALRLVGQCIRSAMRKSDLAFRYGGDEFVTILLNADVSKAQNVVCRINKRIAAKLKEAGDSAGAWLGVSAGIACYPDDATTVDELVRMADAAMYDAKRLAWARGVMGRGQAVTSVAYPAEAIHEAQAGMLSDAANSLTAALKDLTAPDAVAESDLRTIAALGAAAEIKDPYTLGHQERTSRLAATLAKEMGLSPERVRNIRTAGLVHDLGKIGVGENILNKPGRLSESEFAKMKEHPALGASMIVSGAQALQPLAPIVRHHHERFDGGGYPDGLARENIPLEARILSVADAFDAMTHERAYRRALSTEEALGEIERGAGTRFDRAVVEAFLGVMRRRGGELG